jgi:AraC family transcriptional regulator
MSVMTETSGRDRLRELIDTVLDGVTSEYQSADPVGGPRRLDQMARDAFSSPWHFSRELRRGTGEPPVALRRRVLLERAAWQIASGDCVTEAAFAAGYDSVEGFTRAFARAYGHPPSLSSDGAPSSGAARHWLPSPNGIHFHPPTSLWVEQSPPERTCMDLTSHLVHHDVDDTRHLLDLATRLSSVELGSVRIPGYATLPWDGPDDSIIGTLQNLVFTKEVWLASIAGADHPSRGDDAVAALATRHERVAPRWLATVADIERRGAWGDTLVDALCDPPESFVLGSVIAHVLTFSAHRRQLVRHMLRSAGLDEGAGLDRGDPIEWLRGPLPQPPVGPAT